MDYQTLFNMAITTAAFFGGWTLSRIYNAIDRLDKDVRDFPKDYVSKDDYREQEKRAFYAESGLKHWSGDW